MHLLATAGLRTRQSLTNEANLLEAAAYIVSDQGSQLRDDYDLWCQAMGIKPRFGAIGQWCSIAIVSRRAHVNAHHFRPLALGNACDKFMMPGLQRPLEHEGARCAQRWTTIDFENDADRVGRSGHRDLK